MNGKNEPMSRWLDKPAPDFFRHRDAENMVGDDLAIFKRELNV